MRGSILGMWIHDAERLLKGVGSGYRIEPPVHRSRMPRISPPINRWPSTPPSR